MIFTMVIHCNRFYGIFTAAVKTFCRVTFYILCVRVFECCVTDVSLIFYASQCMPVDSIFIVVLPDRIIAIYCRSTIRGYHKLKI